MASIEWRLHVHIGLWVTAGKFTHSGLEIPWNVSLVLGTVWRHKFDWFLLDLDWSSEMREPPVKVRDTQHTPLYISDSSWMNSEIFANRLLLWLSVLRFQSDIFRNIHKETTFRLFCDSSQMNSEIFTKRPLFRLCSVIQIGWIQKYSQRDYF